LCTVFQPSPTSPQQRSYSTSHQLHLQGQQVLSLHSYQSVDREQLAKDINEIHQQALANIGIDDFEHLTRMERWGKICSIIGYGTAWIFPNPISALLISQGSFTRWTQVGHPIVHRAYDKVEGVDKNYTSKKIRARLATIYGLAGLVYCRGLAS